MSSQLIYLDNNATTQVAPEVCDAMIPYFDKKYGNPSSLHNFGAHVRDALDTARKQVATLLGTARPTEIVFTSCGTESNNLAIMGVLNTSPHKKHIVTTSVEHSSVSKLCQYLEKQGYRVTYLPVTSDGTIKADEIAAAVTEDTALITIMWANNETGILFPIEEIAQVCQQKKIPLHVDGVQACGKIPISLAKIPIDLLSISGHKLHGPKGVGALYIKRGTKLAPLFIGGGQERGYRSGTENVPGIVGLGVAAQLAQDSLAAKQCLQIAKLRDRLEKGLLAECKNAHRNGTASQRVPNTSSLRFEGLDGEAICLLLSEAGIAASTGSACKFGSHSPSSVLSAMGLNDQQVSGAIRLSLSRYTTEAEINRTLEIFPDMVARLQKQAL